MKKIKLSFPGQANDLDFNELTGKLNNTIGNFQFYINSNIKHADYWFVLENLNTSSDSCIVDPKNIIYLNYETSYPKDYFLTKYMQKYLSQFNYFFGTYELFKENSFHTMPFQPWLINSKQGSSVFDKSEKGYDYLLKNQYYEKNNLISIICSNKVKNDDHKIRLEFAKNLKNHFGSELIWFGHGINDLENKWDALESFKYHIVLENESRSNLVSEKLYDAYLGLTYPIYYGATNIEEYFSKESLSKIDIMDFKKSVKIIEDVVNKKQFENNFNHINRSKELVLTKYNFFIRIAEIAKNLESNICNPKLITLNDVGYHWNKYVSKKNRFKNELKRKLRLDNINT